MSRIVPLVYRPLAENLGLGERYFMQMFMDGDLASNNGGWQWTASVSRKRPGLRGHC